MDGKIAVIRRKRKSRDFHNRAPLKPDELADLKTSLHFGGEGGDIFAGDEAHLRIVVRIPPRPFGLLQSTAAMLAYDMILNSLLRIVLLSAASLPLSVIAQAPETKAQPDNTIRVSLESAYEAWRTSMTAADLASWEATTAFSRQIETRNRIVSQKQPFPQALFDDPVESPSLGGLIHLGVLSTGETATATYFGKANFGDVPGMAVADNLLVLHFLKEDGRWKFDNLRVVKIGNDGEILLQIRNSDFSFLHGAEFQPAPYLTPVPQPVDVPELVAEAWIDATGYEVKITVNGHLTGTFKNIKASELVMGGVKRGQNQIRIESKLIDSAASGASPKVEVALYAAEDPAGQASRVYHFKPGASIAPVVTESFAGQ